MKKSVLVTLADRNFIDPAKQLFSSVYFNSGWPGDYLLLSHDIPEKELKWFRKKGIIVKKVKPLIYNKFNFWGPVIYSKFYLFTSYFKKWENVIYLDSDIIVKDSLDNLTKVNGFYSVTYGNKRLYQEFFKNERKLIKKINKICDVKSLAFNSGVIVFSSDIIKEDTFHDLKNIFEEYKNIADGEEPLLNLYFQRIWNRLPLAYNFPIVLFNRALEIIFGKPIVQHFVLSKKPWKKDSNFYREWKENLDRSDKINLNNRLIIKNSWDEKKIRKFDRTKKLILPLIRIKVFYFESKIKIYQIINRIINETKIKIYLIINEKNRLIGKIGIEIKRINPETYFLLKKIKDKF